ncbi:MAG: hypothetical protein ACRC1G_04015 [Bradyrhizobium sp.]|nr:hypothetical protein [Bradyrhizobium sp.]
MGEPVIFSCLETCDLGMTPLRHYRQGRGSYLPKLPCSAISRTFIARLIKGCRGDGFVQELPVSEKS